jgi:hypothetical protein
VDDAAVRLLDARRDEAATLLAVNQRIRIAAVLTLVAGALLAAAAITLAIALQNSLVLMAAPPVLVLLCALAFQQFAEVSVIGVARAHLEAAVNEQLNGTALLYETVVAPVRQRRPLAASVRILQVVWGSGVLGVLIAGTVAACDQPEVWVAALYSAFTLASVLACGVSYRDMLRSGRIASSAVDLAKVP